MSFERDGFQVFRSAVPSGVAAEWLRAYNAIPARSKPDWNPVNISGPFPEPLSNIPRYPTLLDIAGGVFGPDLALYNFRFVVKDRHSRGAIFTHQDTGYHVGFQRKASLFLALSPVTRENGAMTLYTGTHEYGYLGDAGEINAHLTDEHPNVTPELEPGDAILMNSALWHSSREHTSGPDRVLTDIIYQPANDPSGIELLRGEWRCTPKAFLRGDALFHRSRTSRLRELQKSADKWEFVRKHGLLWADRDFSYDGSECFYGRVAGDHADAFIEERMRK